MLYTGYFARCTLCWVLLLSPRSSVSQIKAGEHLVWIAATSLYGGDCYKAICGCHVLVYDNSYHCRIWWSSSSQHQGNGVWYILHVVQSCVDLLHHWQHDQPHRSRHRPNQKLCKCEHAWGLICGFFLDCVFWRKTTARWNRLRTRFREEREELYEHVFVNEKDLSWSGILFHNHACKLVWTTDSTGKYFISVCWSHDDATSLAHDCVNNACLQRVAVQSILEFSVRNRLPAALQEQMLAHMRLKFKTENLHQQQIMTNLPKSIRANITQYLFLPTVANVYLFQGTSIDFLHQVVSSLKSDWLCVKTMNGLIQ